ncbi:MAG: SDR family NAD(P)-dependent oxidoreductase [Candidatus Bathyarchaeia archaeon]
MDGKVALVTGAAAKRGMGHAIALRLAEAGADVAVLDRDPSPKSLFPGDEDWRGLSEVVEEITSIGRRALALVADVSNVGEVDEAVRRTVEALGQIDILVHCAAIRGRPNVPIVKGDEEEWKRLFEVNLLGSFIVAKRVARQMIAQGKGGKMVFFSSVAGRMGAKDNAAYAASKWGVIGLVQSLALELAPYHINVNAVCPGMIITNLRDRYYLQLSQETGKSVHEIREEEHRQVTKSIPWGRMGTVEDIARVVLFLASDLSDYVTGQSINVCGGLRMD